MRLFLLARLQHLLTYKLPVTALRAGFLPPSLPSDTSRIFCRPSTLWSALVIPSLVSFFFPSSPPDSLPLLLFFHFSPPLICSAPSFFFPHSSFLHCYFCFSLPTIVFHFFQFFSVRLDVCSQSATNGGRQREWEDKNMSFERGTGS